MLDTMIGEIRMFAGDYEPAGWLFCDGRTLRINDHLGLFTVLGTRFGGDGRQYFRLPDLRGRTPIHRGDGHSLGQKGGAETIALTTGEMAPHQHDFKVSSGDFNSRNPTGRVLAKSKQPAYRANESTNSGNLGSATVVNAGGGQSHDNMQPYTTVAFCIALRGLFPSRS